MKTTPSTLLKVMGIIAIILGALGILGGLFSIMGGAASMVAFSDPSIMEGLDESTISGTINGQALSTTETTTLIVVILIAGGVVSMFGGLFELIMGIVSVKGNCKPAKIMAWLCIVLAAITVILGVVTVAQGGFTSIISGIFSMVVPGLILLGVKQTEESRA